MARSRFHSLTNNMHPTGSVGACVMAFLQFVNDDEDDVFNDNVVDHCKCILDIIYVWLARGNATEVCPNFETYLKAVLAIVEEARERPDTFNLDLLHRDRLPVFHFGDEAKLADPEATHPLSPREAATADDGVFRYFGETLPVAGDGYDHPALDRNVYEGFQAMHLRSTRR